MILSRFQGTFRAVSHIPPSTSEFGGCTAKELFPPAIRATIGGRIGPTGHGDFSQPSLFLYAAFCCVLPPQKYLCWPVKK